MNIIQYPVAAINDFPQFFNKQMGKRTVQVQREALYILGTALYQQGKYQDAIPCFLTLSLQCPDNATYYALLGACQEGLGEFAKAINNFAQAFALASTLTQANYALDIARCQIAAEYKNGAINTLMQLLQLELPPSTQTEKVFAQARRLLTDLSRE